MSMESATHAVRARLLDFTGLGYRVAFEIGDEGSITIDASGTTPEIVEDAGGDEDADCVIKLSMENFEKLIAGTLNPTLAYTLGKLKIEGSMGIAMKVAALLEE